MHIFKIFFCVWVKDTIFRSLALLSSSDEGIKPNKLGPLDKANLSPQSNGYNCIPASIKTLVFMAL
jgi:hypothetical protein